MTTLPSKGTTFMFYRLQSRAAGPIGVWRGLVVSLSLSHSRAIATRYGLVGTELIASCEAALLRYQPASWKRSPSPPTLDHSITIPWKGTLLQADHLCRRHPDGRAWLLDDISLAIDSGSRLVLTGPSGGGKTLPLRALARLDPLDRGDVRYRGEPIHHDAIPSFRAGVIYLHQRAGADGRYG